MAATPGTPKGGNPTTDPFIAFNFMLEISGIITAGFHDCSGVDSTIEIIEYREGGPKHHREEAAGPDEV